MKIVNLTPHKINLVDSEGKEIKKFESEGIARCSQFVVKEKEEEGIIFTKTQFGKVFGLPEEEEGKYYIVSRLIMQSYKDRKDLLVPNEIVRDKDGIIIGCKSFSIN